MIRLVALYRALNVGRRRLTMDRLRRVHESEGLADVRTYLAAGNVLFSTAETEVDGLVERLERAFVREAGFESAVVLRTADELRSSIDRNPFLGAGYPLKMVHTAFLRERPAADAVSALMARHRGPELVEVSDREAFVYYADGMARSKLDLTRLGVVGTSRNANTVAKLLELLEQ